MESKKTESNNMKPGWDEANQVLKDNFGNVYDFKRKTINGVRCEMKRDNMDRCNENYSEKNKFHFIVNPSNKVKININNRGLSCTSYLGRIHVDEETFNLEYINGFGYKYPIRAPRNIQDHVSIEETINGEKKTKLIDDGSLDIDFLYNQGIYQGMIVNSSYEMKNLMTNENTSRHEAWMNDYLVSTDSRMDSRTIKVYPKKPNSNDYANQPIFNKTFNNMNVHFIGKKGNLCYVHEEQEKRGLLLVFDITTNEIVTKYETPKIFGSYDFNMDDLENVVEIMQQKDCNKYGHRDFNKALSKYLTYKQAKYNMSTPSKKGLLRGG